MNSMRKLRIAKVVLNIGVGEAGERLSKAETVLQKISGSKPVRTLSRSTNRDLGIRLGMPIGCKVTLRGTAAEKLLKDSLWVRENRLPAYCFSKTGSLSFGIPDYTGYKNESYDPDIGIFGLDIAVAFERPGFRVARRKIKKNKIGGNHRITADECREFMKSKFALEVFNL
tara:strand:+ start:931 stop:1443 length:513 start_codon:yes stop_codon:yes gene_type:complete